MNVQRNGDREQEENARHKARGQFIGFSRERIVAIGLFVLLAGVVVALGWFRTPEALEKNSPPTEHLNETASDPGLVDDEIVHYAMLPDLKIGARLAKPVSQKRYAGLVRVHLATISAKRPLRFRFEHPVKVIDVDGQKELLHSQTSQTIYVRPSQSGIRFGKHRLNLNNLEIRPATAQPSIWLNDHLYHGRVRLHRKTNGRLAAVNVVAMEDYLASVVDSEMPAAFPIAARQAQAIVARTYALYQCQQSAKHPYFDLYADTRSQKYLGYQYYDRNHRHLAGESKQSRQIVRDTRAIVCTHRNQLFCTYFSAVCGGQTTAGRHVFTDAGPSLQSVECSWCRDAKRFRWSVQIPNAKLESQLTSYFRGHSIPMTSPLSIKPAPGVPHTNPMQAPLWNVVDAARNTQSITRPALRRLFPSRLPSPHFIAEADGANWNFQGRGHGHGVGLCQWGARGLALGNRRATDIVRYYYPGSDISVLHAAK